MQGIFSRLGARDREGAPRWERILTWASITAALVISVACVVTRAGWSGLVGLWPFLLILACPLIMAMMGSGKRDQGDAVTSRSAGQVEHQP